MRLSGLVIFNNLKKIGEGQGEKFFENMQSLSLNQVSNNPNLAFQSQPISFFELKSCLNEYKQYSSKIYRCSLNHNSFSSNFNLLHTNLDIVSKYILWNLNLEKSCKNVGADFFETLKIAEREGMSVKNILGAFNSEFELVKKETMWIKEFKLKNFVRKVVSNVRDQHNEEVITIKNSSDKL